MKCDNSCIYYNVISATNIIKDEPVFRFICDFNGEQIKDIPECDRENCVHYKTKKFVDEEWKSYLDRI